MSGRRYTVLGWLVWQIGTRVARRKLAQTRGKLAAAAVVALVLAAGAAVAREIAQGDA